MTAISSEMAARVLAVRVEEGAQVSSGEELVLLESMKMEIPVLAPASGRVERVSVGPGQLVGVGDVLVELSVEE